MRARIDISEVEVGTKIRAKYLRALENEEWDLLPGPVYVKSFLRTYADFLGLDSRLLVDEFKRRYERPSDHEARAVSSTARERERHSKQPGALSGLLFSPRSVIVVALVVIVAALYVIGSHGKTPAQTGNPITPATGGGGGGSRKRGGTDGKRHHRGSGGSRTGTNPSRGAARTTTTGAGTSPATTGTGTSTGTLRATTTTGPSTTGTGTSATGTTPTGAQATLTIVPTAKVWICVEGQSGTPLMPAVDYYPGQTIPQLRNSTLLVTLGNTNVTLTADGKPYPISGGQVTNLEITPAGVKPAPTTFSCG